MNKVERCLRKLGIDVKGMTPSPDAKLLQRWLREAQVRKQRASTEPNSELPTNDELPISFNTSGVKILDEREIGGIMEYKIGYFFDENDPTRCIAAYVFDQDVDLKNTDSLLKLLQSIDREEWEEVNL